MRIKRESISVMLTCVKRILHNEALNRRRYRWASIYHSESPRLHATLIISAMQLIFAATGICRT